MKKTAVVTGAGRPVKYTDSFIDKIKKRMKTTGKSLKRVVATLNGKRKPTNQINYVSLLVAMARLGKQLRPPK